MFFGSNILTLARLSRAMGRKILTIDVSRPIAEISDDLVSAARDTGFWYIKGMLACAL